MKKKRIDVITLGCSKNLVDSERLLKRLCDCGFDARHDSENIKGDTVRRHCRDKYLRIYRRRKRRINKYHIGVRKCQNRRAHKTALCDGLPVGTLP